MHYSRWQIITYAAIIMFGILAAVPSVLTPAQRDALPGFLPHKHVTLGLDLRGGSHLVLEVDREGLLKSRLETLREDALSAMREERLRYGVLRVQNDALEINFPDAAARDAALPVLRKLATPVGGQTFGGGEPSLDIATSGPTNVHIAYTEAGLRDRISSAVEQSLEIVRRRVDQVGVSEPTIQRVGSDRLLVQLPGLQDPARLRELLGSTAQLTFHMLSTTTAPNGQLPPGVTMMPSAEGDTSYPVVDRVALSGERLTDAKAGFDPRTQEPVVNFSFDSEGARRFGEITRQNVGQPFAIVLDGKVLSAPVIREPITGGSGQISGSFSVEDTVVLSALLRAGALPAPLTVVEERTVGPDLGNDSIRMGIYTGLIGFGLVVVFIMVLYRGWGLIANLALGLNVILTLGALSLLGATLTLPGIAGIILGVGMAVDANVLINERIREEARKGVSSLKALDSGFKHAYSTIIDSNVTTLIATSLLFMFGSGPVKGFAVTMAIGIGISLFTAVTVVRVIMTEIVRRQPRKPLVIKPLFPLVPENTNISFMKARFMGIGVSIVLSVGSIILFFTPGLSYGIDFKGGIQMNVEMAQPADLAELRKSLGELGLGEVALQQFGSDRDVLIRLERQPGGEKAQTAAADTVTAELTKLYPGVDIQSTQVVGPKVSGELATSGILAVVLASIAMLIYIWWRFEWFFAVGAIATLVLDTTKTIGFFALAGLDFNLTAIAALLTIIGYSVNDKVVVYDRMRENMRLYKSMSLRQLIDTSINQTLARCVFTSMTTFLAMLPMAMAGGSAVESFAVPMVFGVVIATSSSIFIAAPILLFLGDWASHHKRRPANSGAKSHGAEGTPQQAEG